MPTKGTKETLFLIINVGISTCDSDGVRILEKFKLIAKYLIERKIFLQPQSEIGLILMGSEDTKNDLGIDHIEEYINVQVANWDVLDDIMVLKSTEYKTNWLDAVSVALDYIERENVDAAIKKLVLLSHFKEESEIKDGSLSDSIVDALTTQGIQLVAIGEKDLQSGKESSFAHNEIILKELCVKVGAINLTLADALKHFRFYKRQQSKPTAWPCILEIADIMIPIAAYVKITEDSKLPAWKQVVGKDEDAKGIQLSDPVKVGRHKEYLDRHREICKPENTTFAYLYGGQPVPFTEEDEKTMVYKSGEKSYKVHSFTHRKYVGIKHWNTGSSTRVVVPRTEAAARSFYSLVQAMVEMDLIAIVRKTYNASATPRMVALFPCSNSPGEPWCLAEIELPFAEDRRLIGSRPLKSMMKQLTKEQDEAVDNLLQSLMLPEDDIVEGTENYAELYNPGYVQSPAIQHTWDMLSFRATNPEKPLPAMAPELRQILKPPACINEKTAQHIEKIKNLFELEIVEDDSKKKRSMYGKADEGVVPEKPDKKKDDAHDKSQTDDISSTPVLSLSVPDVDLEELAANI